MSKPSTPSKSSSTGSTPVNSLGAGDNSIGPGPKVEKNGLYMLLWPTDVVGKYHWGLFIAQSETTGVLFHQNLSGLKWIFIMETKNTTTSKSLLAGLKLGVMQNVNDKWIKSVKDCVRATEVEGEFTCRTWALAALYDLADSGYIGLMPNWGEIYKIEEEAKQLAKTALMAEEKIVIPSEMSAP